MRYFPVFLDLEQRTVIVIGEAEPAAARVRLLAKTPANVVVYCDEPNALLREATRAAGGRMLYGFPDDADLAKAALVYLATASVETVRGLGTRCRALGIPVNAVDDRASSNFLSAAIVDRNPVVVAISSSGTAPVLARRIKNLLEDLLDTNLGELAQLAAALRPRVRRALDFPARRRFWTKFFDGDAARLLRRLSFDTVRRHYHGKLGGARAKDDGIVPDKPATVSLVGAGPGDPELLTLKARRAIDQADVVLSDRLTDPRVLDLVRRDALLIEVGKRAGGQSWRQDAINDLMVEHALKGADVVRLKCGDPMIFGRADEELDALERAGIRYEIIPGVTAAAAAAAGMGRSLTRRARNSSLTVMTAHDAEGLAEHEWRTFAQGRSVAAIYMGVGAARFVQGRLLLHGASPALPVCVVENAARHGERIIDATVGDMTEMLTDHAIASPAIIFIGLKSRRRAAEQERETATRASHALAALPA